MAISFASGFDMLHTEPVDSRLVLTKEEMLNMKKPQMPSVYLCVCSDDGKLYLYNKTNEINEETGRFRVINIENSEFDEDSIGIITID